MDKKKVILGGAGILVIIVAYLIYKKNKLKGSKNSNSGNQNTNNNNNNSNNVNLNNNSNQNNYSTPTLIDEREKLTKDLSNVLDKPLCSSIKLNSGDQLMYAASVMTIDELKYMIDYYTKISIGIKTSEMMDKVNKLGVILGKYDVHSW
jgi:hypothetical protein